MSSAVARRATRLRTRPRRVGISVRRSFSEGGRRKRHAGYWSLVISASNSVVRLRGLAAETIEFRLLLVVERRVEVLERRPDGLGRRDHGFQPLLHHLKPPNRRQRDGR